MDIAYVAIIIFAIIASFSRRHLHRKKIENHIKLIGGENVSIETISSRDNVYSASYYIDGKYEKKLLDFPFLMEKNGFE